MAFKAYFREDIHNTIEGIRLANSGNEKLFLLLNDPRLTILLAAYRSGFHDALDCVNISFGSGKSQLSANIAKELTFLLNESTKPRCNFP